MQQSNVYSKIEIKRRAISKFKSRIITRFEDICCPKKKLKLENELAY